MRRIIVNDSQADKVISWRRIGFALGLTSMLAAAGCQDRMLGPVMPSSDETESLPFEESSGTQTLLASVALEDGSVVDFLEVDDGIVISGIAADWDGSLVRSAFEIDEVEPVAIYEQLAHAPAPDALVAVQRRVGALVASAGVAPDEPASSDELTIGPETKNPTEERPDLTIWAPGVQSGYAFMIQYCYTEFTNLNWNLAACWLDKSRSDWTVYRYSTGQLGVAHCKSGYNLWHTLLKYDFGSGAWKSVLPVEKISTGQSSWYYHWGAPGYYRSLMYNVGSWEDYHLTFKVL